MKGTKTRNQDREPKQGTKIGNQDREQRLRTKAKNGVQRIRKDKDGEKSLLSFRSCFPV